LSRVSRYSQHSRHSKSKSGSSGRGIKILWLVFLLGVLGLTSFVLMVNAGWMGYMPSMEELENPNSAISSDVIANDGTVIGRYYVLDRSTSKFSEISPNIISALLATEDARYYEHSGIDAIGTIAIPFYVLTGKKRGSSTITQQLAKNLFPRKNESKLTMPLIKLKEWIMAVKLEKNLTKNEIITLYLNIVPFSDNVYGIKNASMTFFNKTPDKVSVEEAAVLIAMLKATNTYNPRTHLKLSMERRNTVLEQMSKYGYISEAEAGKLSQKPIVLDYHKQDYHEGVAPYFRMVVEQQVKQICKDLKKPDGSKYDIYKDGLKIYTTLDIKMQQYAEEAVEEHLTTYQKVFMGQHMYQSGNIWDNQDAKNVVNNAIKQSDRYQAMKDMDVPESQIDIEMHKPVKMKVFSWAPGHNKDTIMSPIDSIKYMKLYLQAGFMCMDPFTGEVKAWVGGIDHTYFQYDHVNINTKRQVGSTIKPILYCLAVDNGFSPCGTVSTSPQEFPQYMTKPYDADHQGYGTVSMAVALAKSINNAALYIEKQVGINAFVDFIHKCGISSKIDPVPAAALGVADISLYEMLGAYSMFPDGGINTQPYYITKIEDKNGLVLKTFAPVQKEIINNSTSFKMIKLMREVVNQGTGHRLRFRYNFTNDIAGKTGTTSNQADAWFIGYTPQIIAGGWVGHDDRVFRFGTEDMGQGAAAALPVWAIFMKKVYADKSLRINNEKIDYDAVFKEPDGFDDCDVTDPVSEARKSTYGSSRSEAEPVEHTSTDEWDNGHK